MSNTQEPGGQQNGDFFDQLLTSAPKGEHSAFTQAFRGYDKAEVDAALATLRDQVKRLSADMESVDARHRAELEEARNRSEQSIADALADSDADVARLEQELASSARPRRSRPSRRR